MTHYMGSCSSCIGIDTFCWKYIWHVVLIQLRYASNSFTRNCRTLTHLDTWMVVTKKAFQIELSYIIGNNTTIGLNKFGQPNAYFFDLLILPSNEKAHHAKCMFLPCLLAWMAQKLMHLGNQMLWASKPKWEDNWANGRMDPPFTNRIGPA